MSVIDRGAKSEESPGKGLALPSRKPKTGGPAAPLAAPPRARLLPPEVGRRKRDRALRGRVWAAVVVVVVLAAGGTGASFWYATQAAGALASTQADGLALQKKAASYNELKSIKSDLQARAAAQAVGGAGDVDWSDYLRRIQATLPGDVTMTDVSVKMGSADSGAAPASTSTAADEGPATIATVTFNASTSTVPSIPDWIDSLSGLPGFVNAEPGSVTNSGDLYTASVTMTIGQDALSYKYIPKPEEAQK